MSDKRLRHGRIISSIGWPDSEFNEGGYIHAKPDEVRLWLEVSHHGDHDQIWVIYEEMGNVNGDPRWIEKHRYNPRYLEVISFRDDD